MPAEPQSLGPRMRACCCPAAEAAASPAGRRSPCSSLPQPDDQAVTLDRPRERLLQGARVQAVQGSWGRDTWLQGQAGLGPALALPGTTCRRHRGSAAGSPLPRTGRAWGGQGPGGCPALGLLSLANALRPSCQALCPQGRQLGVCRCQEQPHLRGQWPRRAPSGDSEPEPGPTQVTPRAADLPSQLLLAR